LARGCITTKLGPAELDFNSSFGVYLLEEFGNRK
jgi:hypothetical protein